ncbi:hypothetical protein EGYY_09700 [Eggerthella sp. YY7918]|nr:hypothetical protein EGYY_09700 [Eggerthella sp. YY7918]
MPEIAPFRGRACFAREGKRKRGEIGCLGASQRRVVPLAGKPAEQYMLEYHIASGPDDRALQCEESPGSTGQDAS